MLPSLTGTYAYRSLLNSTFIGEDFLKLKFGEGLITLTQDTTGHLTGSLDMGGGYVLTLEGSLYADGSNFIFRMTGYGVAGSPTAGWIYDYQGVLTPMWPNGVNQLITITGSVIRTVEHGPTSPAGVTCTFYMVSRS